MNCKSLPLTLGTLLCLLGLSAGLVAGQDPAASRQSESKHVRLLTVGNSFSRNATRYLEDIVRAGGHRLTHRAIVVGGASLQVHADKALEYERDALASAGLYASGRSLQQELLSDAWDYVTIQQASIKSHNIATYRPFAAHLQSIVNRYAPMAELLVHQTWAYRNDDPRFSQASDDPLEPKTQAEMYHSLTNANKTIASELGIRRIPVGDAFFLADTHEQNGYQPDAALDRETAEYPQLPNQAHSLHVGWRWQSREAQPQSLQMDGHHANTAGEYLGACVWYEVLFQESCVGNAFVPPGVDREYATFLQQTAHRAVLAAAPFTPAPQLSQEFNDPQPQRYRFEARASQLDPQAKEYPEINFVFGTDDKPQDLEHATVDTRVVPRGKLVIWLMADNDALFERLNSYGLHAIQVSYANKWFGTLCRPRPKDAQARGNVRLEAATGEDVSDELDLGPHDGMTHRAFEFVKWLSKKNPQGRWEQFLRSDGRGIRWDKVIIAGSSHGSTTAARFAKHQRVDRVVMHCGPRDQDQDWQANRSATPENRYFGFSHVLDGGWTGDHYCRSWELLGLHQFGRIVNVDNDTAPYDNSRRLISAADVGGDANRAHSSVTPGRSSPKGADGEYLFEPVWRYLYTQPVELVGEPTEEDADCQRVHVQY